MQVEWQVNLFGVLVIENSFDSNSLQIIQESTVSMAKEFEVHSEYYVLRSERSSICIMWDLLSYMGSGFHNLYSEYHGSE